MFVRPTARRHSDTRAAPAAQRCRWSLHSGGQCRDSRTLHARRNLLAVYIQRSARGASVSGTCLPARRRMQRATVAERPSRIPRAGRGGTVAARCAAGNQPVPMPCPAPHCIACRRDLTHAGAWQKVRHPRLIGLPHAPCPLPWSCLSAPAWRLRQRRLLGGTGRYALSSRTGTERCRPDQGADVPRRHGRRPRHAVHPRPPGTDGLLDEEHQDRAGYPVLRQPAPAGVATARCAAVLGRRRLPALPQQGAGPLCAGAQCRPGRQAQPAGRRRTHFQPGYSQAEAIHSDAVSPVRKYRT